MKTILYILILTGFTISAVAQQTRPDTMKVQQLKDIVVTSRPPQVERRNDKVIFNVQNSILASGSTVWDALRKAPGIQTNESGQVTQGTKSMTVYIDGKQVQMTGEDLTAYLSGLPADNVSKIEIMRTPSAKYDIQGGGIVNIITKKSKAQGFNGTINGAYTQATFGSQTAGGTFNYKQNKLNIYGNYGFTNKSIRRLMNTYTIYETPDSYSDWRGRRAIDPVNKSHSYQLGLDYDINPKQVFGFRVTGFNSDRNTDSRTISNVFNDHVSAADSTLNTNGRSNSASNNYSFNLNYKIKLDSAGKSLNIDVDYVPYTNNNRQYVNALTYIQDKNVNDNFNIFTPSTQRINIWSGKADLTYKIAGKWDMESGIKYTSINSDNLFLYNNVLEGGLSPDDSKSNNFKYTENTAAAYTSISGSLGKWDLQAGLRGEQTRTTGNSITQQVINKRNYLRLFPTLFITYKASDDHVFSFNYNSRMERPAYMQLNPARSYSSPYSFQQGNPALRPAIFTSGELSYTFKQNYTLTASYSKLKDLVSNVTVQDNASKTFYDTQQNLDNIEDFTLGFMTNLRPTDWWDMNVTVEGAYRRQHSLYTDGYFASDNYIVSLNTTQSFVLSKKQGIKAELSGRYESPVYQGVYHVDRTSDISLGFSKSILKQQGTVKLAFADIFYKNPYKLDIAYLQQRNGMIQKNDTRNISVSFSYKFGKNTFSSRKRQTASEEERRRAN
ncbi:Outer membrane receptor proteins, mostly Fe transport [Chitinophaga sp. YR627]|uniref:outer membrane beta-barrel family protein n=1 Tax=Chitinophaga sp. YR627 TaxID=1881041 RepID=UPI0008F15B09|nr:outer membrane beta-barrel family protein [Chitinophaga sp. YR627]SFO81802.1 Outer membrane receptor proteins, mostly Fe transport [Chitinophaga sp. YR627]